MTARERRRRGELSDEDNALWASVTRSVRRLRKVKPAAPATPTLEATAATIPLRAAPKPTTAVKKAAAKTRTAIYAVPAPPPSAGLERRLKQRLARGVQAIDARIDLHGLTQAEAHAALGGFLRAAQRKSAKVVLIITGKGGREHGVLRRAVPLWLGLAEWRGMVVGFETAGPAHGGEGALYVRVRKLRA
jgi:DNA-nicking Smr family endonuclease